MVEFFHFKKDIPFMKYGKLTTLISAGTFVIAVLFLLIRGYASPLHPRGTD
jgi:preprotein translocase subunit SecF